MVGRRRRFAVSWRRAGMGLRISVIMLGAMLFALLVYLRGPDEETVPSGNRLLVFALVNLNIVVLCILAFLIGRNIVKLVFDRRRGILGSQLRTRLVVAFVGLSLIPTAIIFILASGLLNRAMEGWFSTQVEATVSGALEVAQKHHQSVKTSVERVTRHLLQELDSEVPAEQETIERYLEGQRRNWGLYSIRMFRPDNSLVLVQSPTALIDGFLEPPLNENVFSEVRRGAVIVQFEEQDASQFMRAYARGRDFTLVVTFRLDAELTQALHGVNDSFREYKQLKLYSEPLKSGYTLTLSLITGLILFAAIWIAFYIARELTVPIQRLAEATRAVARGKYDIKIREMGGDELALLVRSFNQMTADLKQSKIDAERRRIFIETILANLAVGVVAVDRALVVTAVNEAALSIIEHPQDEGGMVGKPLAEVLGRGLFTHVEPLVMTVQEAEQEEGGHARAQEQEVTVSARGKELKVVCTVGVLRSSDSKVEGYALLFDDITELSKAQHMAAWREVAQRIAHEIKNPLTPIQLSAQRLAKLLREEPAPENTTQSEPLPVSTARKVLDCVNTIVEHVDSIKRLANEFSHFARMPRAEFALEDINRLIASAIEPFAEAHDHIVFQFIADNTVPPIPIDKEQIRRIIINLIDNAIAAVGDTANLGESRITVRTHHDREARSVSFEVADTGPGISANDRARIFEPYFTTKEGGTGLGLAIVTSIVADHQGEVRVYENKPYGARFVVEIPISPKRATLRKFAA